MESSIDKKSKVADPENTGNNQDTTDTAKPTELKKKVNSSPYAPPMPTQEAFGGILYDFCDGIRLYFPEGTEGKYKVILSESDTGIIFAQTTSKDKVVLTSMKKYMTGYTIKIYKVVPDDDKCSEPELAFYHRMSLEGKDVILHMDVESIGDVIGWFSYAERFKEKYKCNLIVAMNPKLITIFKDQYKDIKFITSSDIPKEKPYAMYQLGLFFNGDDIRQPVDFRVAGLHRTAGYILNVDKSDIPPRVNLSAPRKIKEKYVCIATKASSYTKCWNSVGGWRVVIDFLKRSGYRVLCIDKDREITDGLHVVDFPWGCEDFTGNKSLQERIDLIKDCDFFIGVSSGLSWLAWCCKVPVVLISGFTAEYNEFSTPYRVINYNVCNSCWNDIRCEFDHKDFMWCPRHKGDSRQFECSRFITPDQVINTVVKIPGFTPPPRRENLVFEPLLTEDNSSLDKEAK